MDHYFAAHTVVAEQIDVARGHDPHLPTLNSITAIADVS